MMFKQDYERAYKTRSGRLMVFDGAYAFHTADADLPWMDGRVAVLEAVASWIPTHEEMFFVSFPDATDDEVDEMVNALAQDEYLFNLPWNQWSTFEGQLR